MLGCWCHTRNCHTDFLKSLIDELAYRIQRKRHLHFLVGDATAPDTDTTGPGWIGRRVRGGLVPQMERT